MARPRKWGSDAERKAAIRTQQDTDEFGFALEEPKAAPPEPRIAGTRAEAIERGRAIGVDETERRRESGHEAEQRIARASAYAAWEWDGKPQGRWDDYCEEFGVVISSPVIGSFERPAQK